MTITNRVKAVSYERSENTLIIDDTTEHFREIKRIALIPINKTNGTATHTDTTEVVFVNADSQGIFTIEINNDQGYAVLGLLDAKFIEVPGYQPPHRLTTHDQAQQTTHTSSNADDQQNQADLAAAQKWIQENKTLSLEPIYYA